MTQKKTQNTNMSFLSHLEILRWLLIRSTIYILICAIVAFIFREAIFNIIFAPKDPNFITYKFFCNITKLFGIEGEFCMIELPFSIQNRTMDGQFNMMIWTSITVGFILSVPLILWEFWKFISPGLYQNERKYAKSFILSSSILFFIGILFGYYIITPLSVHFLSNMRISTLIENQIDLNSYIGMVKSTSLASGLVFELPMTIYFLSLLEIINSKFLKDYRKYAIVIILILAAIITPPDVISQTIVFIPLFILYEFSIYIAKFVEKKNKLKDLKNESDQ